MIERRPFASLGGANHGWLDAKHHFSFAEYQDNKRMNWGTMRVWISLTFLPPVSDSALAKRCPASTRSKKKRFCSSLPCRRMSSSRQ